MMYFQNTSSLFHACNDNKSLARAIKGFNSKRKGRGKEVWGNFNKVKCILKKVRLCWLGSEYSECSECSDFSDYSDYSDLFILIVHHFIERVCVVQSMARPSSTSRSTFNVNRSTFHVAKVRYEKITMRIIVTYRELIIVSR